MSENLGFTRTPVADQQRAVARNGGSELPLPQVDQAQRVGHLPRVPAIQRGRITLTRASLQGSHTWGFYQRRRMAAVIGSTVHPSHAGAVQPARPATSQAKG